MKQVRAAILLAAGVLVSGSALVPAQDHDNGHGQGNGQGNGHGKGHDKNKHGDDRDGDDYIYYHQKYRDSVHVWYGEHYTNLPPGLAKKDHLPPGLEKQLVRNGTLPPGLQKKLYRCPEDLDRRLPPPPPDCRNMLVGGHVVLLNVHTNIVVDILHIELY
jgi:hypothetical protein